MLKIKNILQHYPQEQKDFIMRTLNAFDDVSNRDMIRSLGFCEPNLVTIISELAQHYPEVGLVIDGGYEAAEKQKVMLFPKYFPPPPTDIIIYQINYSNKFVKLQHGQILGTLLNSGFDYSKFGDIIVNEAGICNLVVDQVLADTLPFMITNIAKQNVTFIPIEQVVISSIIPNEKTIRVKSIRVDVFVKGVIRGSRIKAQHLINSKMVKVNYTNLLDIKKVVKENDIISIRGYGRFKIVRITPTNKGSYQIIYR